MRNENEQDWLQLIFDNISDAIILLDRRGMIRYANDSAAKMAGYTSAKDLLDVAYEEVLGNNQVYDDAGVLLQKASFPSTRAFEQGIGTKDMVVRQVSLRDGKQHWLNISTVPLLADDGSTRFVIVFYGDISERKSKEDKLRFMVESEKILSATPDFHTRLAEKAKLLVPLLADWCTINIVNDDGSVSRIAILHRDPDKISMLEEFATLSAEESNSKSGMYNVIRTGIAELYPVLSEEILAGAGASSERLALAHALRPCSAMIVPILSSGRVLGALSLSYAESDRRYSEDDLEFMQEFCYHLGVLVDNARLYKEIAERDAAKDAFLAALSHELRNPLAPIRSSLELLRLQCADAAVLEQLGIIEHQFDGMTKILNDLLDVTRFTQGKLHLEKRPLDARMVAERVLKGNDAFLRKRNIHPHIELPAEPVLIDADETRLEQALTNIVHNAEKFTPPNGNIWIELHSHGGQASISIRDDGIGISETDLPRIFDRHYQSPRNRPHQKSGLGLGLVLVREIVSLHDGQIEAQSEGPGKGSRFVVTLPLIHEPLDAKDDVVLDTIAGPVQKILIADDNVEAADGLRKLIGGTR